MERLMGGALAPSNIAEKINKVLSCEKLTTMIAVAYPGTNSRIGHLRPYLSNNEARSPVVAAPAIPLAPAAKPAAAIGANPLHLQQNFLLNVFE